MTNIYYEQVVHRLRELGQLGIGMAPVRLPLEPEPDEIEAINDDLRDIAVKVDAVVRAYGEYLAHHAHCVVDQSVFTDQLSKAIEGNATYEVTCVADDLREEVEVMEAV